MLIADLVFDLSGGTASLRRVTDDRPKASRVFYVWHDSADGALAAQGLLVEERRAGRVTSWRLLRTRPEPGGAWLPGQPAEVLREAAGPAALEHGVKALVAVGRLAATQREATRREDGAGSVRVALLEGALMAGTGLAGERVVPVARLRLRGPAEAVTALARRLPVAVPRQVLAALATEPPPRRLGPATGLDGAMSVGAGFAHVLAQLTDVILHHAPAAALGEESEPVHQLRVAVRRLRSVTGLFRRAVACPALAEAEDGLKALAAALGPARDWDVFLAGAGAQVAAAFAGERVMPHLLAAAQAQRAAAYAVLRGYLEGPGFRGLGVALACLAATQPWEAEAPLTAYAAQALRRRARRLKIVGDDLSALPEAALHDIRLNAKRLRYACEVFAPLFPGRHAPRMIRRLTAVQEALGHLNDGSVAAALMARLGPAGRGRAGGLVRGYVAGRAARGLEAAQRDWRRLRAVAPFWQ